MSRYRIDCKGKATSCLTGNVCYVPREHGKVIKILSSDSRYKVEFKSGYIDVFSLPEHKPRLDYNYYGYEL